MVKNPPISAGEARLIPGQGIKILPAACLTTRRIPCAATKTEVTQNKYFLNNSNNIVLEPKTITVYRDLDREQSALNI